MESYFIGLDFGTSGCRAEVMNQNLESCYVSRYDLPASVAFQNKSEQNPLDWIKYLELPFNDISQNITTSQIKAIAIDGTSATTLLCSIKGEPLTPAFMYNDSRCAKEAEIIRRFAPNDSIASTATSSLAKTLHHYNNIQSEKCFAVHQSDWLTGYLCGQYNISDEHNCLKMGYDVVNKQWPDWINKLGFPVSLLPKVYSSGRFIKTIDARLAKKWNLPETISIHAGTTDSTAAFLATGVNEKGGAVTSLGSTLVLKIMSDRPAFSSQYGVYSHQIGKHWLVGGASNTGGAVLKRYFTSQQIEQYSQNLNPDALLGLNYYPLIANGERFPVSDPELKPRLMPRPADEQLFFQGILEGITDVECQGYQILQSLTKTKISHVVTSGGGSKNILWQKMREDRLQLSVNRASHSEASYGAALLAFRGCGS